MQLWLAVGLSAGCALVGLLHLLRLAIVRGDPLVEASSTAMAVGMAAMFWPFGNPVPEPVWTAVFLAGAVWSAALALRARSIGGDAGHHLVCSGAMIFMLVGHGEHGAAGFRLASVAALVLAGYFAWHVLRCVDKLGAAGPSRVLSVREPRAAATAHLVMTVTMSGMLIAMV